MALGGWGVQKFGYVNFAKLGSALVVLSLLLDSIVPSTSWLFLSFSLMSGTGCGLLCVPYCMALYSRLSGQMLPVAVGFAAAGGGVGTIVFNSALEPLTKAWGWRHARQVLAAALLVILTLNTLALGCGLSQKPLPDDSDVSEGSSDEASEEESSTETEKQRSSRMVTFCKEFVKPFGSLSFGFLCVGLVLYMGGFTVPYTHLVYYAELHGYKDAAMLVSILGAGSIVGRILCGFDVGLCGRAADKSALVNNHLASRKYT